MKATSPIQLTPHELAHDAARLTLTKRAEDVVILDLRELEGSRGFVISTGHSEI